MVMNQIKKNLLKIAKNNMSHPDPRYDPEARRHSEDSKFSPVIDPKRKAQKKSMKKKLKMPEYFKSAAKKLKKDLDTPASFDLFKKK